MAKHKKNKDQNEKANKARSPVLHLFFVVFFLVFVPVIYSKTTIEPAVYPRFLAIAVGLLILFLALLFQKRGIPNGFFKKAPVLFSGLFIVITGVSLFFAINPVEGLADLLKWILVFLIMSAVYLLSKQSQGFIKLIVKGIIVSTLLAVLIGLYQFFTEAFQNDDPNALYEVSGLMGHKNQFSISLFLMLPFLAFGALSFKDFWKKAAYLGFIGAVLLIAMLQTRAVWIALMLSGILSGTGWLLLKSKKSDHKLFGKVPAKLVITVFGIIFIAGAASFIFSGKSPAKRIASIFDSQNTSNEWRIEMWIATVDLIKDHPVTGVGAGNWKIAVYPYYGRFQPSVYRHWRNTHNDFLQISAEKGLGGLVLYLFFYGSMIFYGIRIYRKSPEYEPRLFILFLTAMIAGFLVISFFSFPTERMNHLMYLGLVAGLMLSVDDQNFNSDKQETDIGSYSLNIPVTLVLLFAIYFGYNTIQSEIYISRAQKLKDSPVKKEFARMAKLGNRPLVPFEPRYSFPVINYSGLADYVYDHNNEKALESFKEAYRQHPSNFAVINNVGSVYGEMGRYDSSIAYYQKTLDIFNHYDQGLLNMAKAWYLKKDYRKAYYYILCCDPKSKVEDIAAFRSEVEKKLNQ